MTQQHASTKYPFQVSVSIGTMLALLLQEEGDLVSLYMGNTLIYMMVINMFLHSLGLNYL